jgi:hypothetical protein
MLFLTCNGSTLLTNLAIQQKVLWGTFHAPQHQATAEVIKQARGNPMAYRLTN